MVMLKKKKRVNLKNVYDSEILYVLGLDLGSCETFFLLIKKKTKDLLVDLRRNKVPVYIHGISVDMVEKYKYLGIYLGKKLDLSKQVDFIYRQKISEESLKIKI